MQQSFSRSGEKDYVASYRFTGRSKGPGGGLGTQRERSARFAQRLTSHPPPSSPEMLKMECFHAARVHAFATCLQQESRNNQETCSCLRHVFPCALSACPLLRLCPRPPTRDFSYGLFSTPDRATSSAPVGVCRWGGEALPVPPAGRHAIHHALPVPPAGRHATPPPARPVGCHALPVLPAGRHAPTGAFGGQPRSAGAPGGPPCHAPTGAFGG